MGLNNIRAESLRYASLEIRHSPFFDGVPVMLRAAQKKSCCARATRGRFERLEHRYLLTGEPDLSFNPDGAFGPFPGAVTTDFGSIHDQAVDVAIQPGGGIDQDHIVMAAST